MRIGFVIGLLGRGGAELQLIRLSTGLAARGHEVSVLAYDGASAFDDELRRAGVRLDVAEARSRREKLRVVRGWLRDSHVDGGGFDVVHGIMNLASSLAILGRLPAQRPAVIATDYSTATDRRRDVVSRASLATFALADRVVTESDQNRENLARMMPWLRRKTVVIRNGLDPERFRPRPAGVDARNDRFAFCAVGTVHAVKNPMRVVEAVAELVKRGHHGFHVDWYGRLGGPINGQAAGSEGRQALERASAIGVDRYITFHGDIDDVERAYQGADALLHAALREGFPNAVAEGMACGLPIVVSRVSDLPRVVAEARNGYVFDETDPAAIADAMEQMMRATALDRAGMGRRSRELALRWFGLDRFIGEHEAMYRSCITDRG